MDDDKYLYSVTNDEVQDYSQSDRAIASKSHTMKSTSGGSMAKGFTVKLSVHFLLCLLVFILMLLLVLQSVTVYDLRVTERTCSVSDGETSAATGSNPVCTCNYTGVPSVSVANNTELLKRVNEILADTKNIVSFNSMQAVYSQNSTDMLHETVQGSDLKLTDIIGTLTSIKDNTITTEGIVNDVLMLAKEVLRLQNASSQVSPPKDPTSCQDIRNSDPDSPSGYYHIHSQIVYCQMGELCGVDGGWTRLSAMDMSDATVSCPTGFRLYEVSGVRACGRPVGGPSCPSIKIPSNGISYSEVCGKVIGYQWGSPDAVDTRFVGPEIYTDINNYYMDGISITMGFPRKHIWSLMAGVSDSQYDDGNCPCNTPPGSAQLMRDFIGNDYFCESGNPSSWTKKLYTNDPLWDGKGCGTQEGNCCSSSGQPWFHKTVNTTTDYLELRVCGDEVTSQDDVPFGQYEIYVK